MKIFLQNRRTGLFVKRQGAWVAKDKDAALFSDSGRAARYCLEHKLANMQIVIHSGNRWLVLRLSSRELMAARKSKGP